MYRNIIILFFITLYSCKVDNKTKLTEVKTDKKNVRSEIIKDTFVVVKGIKDSKNNRVKFNIEYIKSRTSKLSDEIDVLYNPNSQNKNFIPKEFLTKFIKPHKINIGYPVHLPDDYPQSYSFKGFKEYSKFDLFTFTYSDESCCTTLYAVTTKKDSINIISIGVVGFTGGDGGWNGKKIGKWINEYLISNMEYSEYEEPATNNSIEKEIDTIWSEIKILKNGKMKYIEVDKVKYLGSKKIN